ncbi:MAG: His-Xaa-Ser system protein HxsD [Nitrospira sp.]
MNSIFVEFDLNAFSLNVVKLAAYRYLHLFTTDIMVNDQRIQCALQFASTLSQDKTQQIVNDFKKEVLDQDLRERLKAETETVRNLILAHAFSKTGLADQ